MKEISKQHESDLIRKHMKRYRCIKTVIMDDDGYTAFSEGKVYYKTKPEFYPSPDSKICLIDEMGDDHFMDAKWRNEHFKEVKEVSNE